MLLLLQLNSLHIQSICKKYSLPLLHVLAVDRHFQEATPKTCMISKIKCHNNITLADTHVIKICSVVVMWLADPMSI